MGNTTWTLFTTAIAVGGFTRRLFLAALTAIHFHLPSMASCISWNITLNKLPEFPSVLDLSIAAIKKFKRSQLFLPIRRIGPSPAPLHLVSPAPPEAQYQNEFYRALIAVSKGSASISPEFASAQGSKVVGRIDFMITSVQRGDQNNSRRRSPP